RSKYEIIQLNHTTITVDQSMLSKADILYFNATEVAKQFGKDIRDFLKLEGTLEYVSCMIDDSNCGVRTQLDCIKPRRGKYGGTWLHDKLALRFARWCSVPFEYLLDRWIEQRIESEHQRKLARDAARTGYLPMTNAIHAAHDPSRPYHYSNEADLLNRIIFGMPAKQYKLANGVESVRDACDAWQVFMMEKLQRINASLIEIGQSFDERKEQLQMVYNKELAQALPANDCHCLEVAA
ncbi:MAG: KilA-N domain-containing protein, partial [Gallionellaceae bacterium]